MAKKENPNLIFRKEWWDNLRHKSPELFKESLSLLFSAYFDGKPFDPYAFDEQGSNPTPAQDLAIPMLKTAMDDKESYTTKCERNAANAKKRFESQANASERMQSQANACDGMRTQGNIIEGNVKEGNVKESNSSLPSLPSPNPSSVEKSEEEEREELLFSLTFYFLTEGVLNPYTTAQKAIAHNESMNWQVRTDKGIIYDHSHDKLAFLRGWRCERNCYNLNDATIFADFCRETNFSDLSVINDYRGISYQGNLTFLFQHAKQKQAFHAYFQHDKASLNRAFAFIAERFPESKGFSCDIYKKD